jgi:orotidine-5'-phosphate decarboxylase
VRPGRYLETLTGRLEIVGTSLCLGLDPDPGALPPRFSPDLAGVERFARMILDAGLQHAAAVKANLAFFEAFGSGGLAALERLRILVPPAVPFIIDAKRADIGSTAARQAVALFDALGADAVTANPYLGRDAIEPLLEREDRFVYVLCRTSNPSAGELQDASVGGEPLYVNVARRVAEWSRSSPRLGLVVGATAERDLPLIREAAPGLPFLVPGVGAQGGQIAPVLEHGPVREGIAAGRRGGGLLVNVSRGIAATAVGASDPAESLAIATRDWSSRLSVSMVGNS